MKIKDLDWVVLFGGARREEVIETLLRNSIAVKKVYLPKIHEERLKDSSKKFAELGLVISFISKDALDTELSNFKGSVLLSIGFPFIIPDKILNKYYLSLNVHPTLLPKYGGKASGAYVLINNEKYSGSTVHLMTHHVDMGKIIAQSRVELSPFDTLRSMQRKVYSSEPELVLNAIKILDADVPSQNTIDVSNFSYFKDRTPRDSEIDPSKSLIDLVNEIRASDPVNFPSFFYYHKEKMFIKIWREVKPQDEDDLL
jgi:methionyl-tRNA formyltransferase